MVVRSSAEECVNCKSVVTNAVQQEVVARTETQVNVVTVLVVVAEIRRVICNDVTYLSTTSHNHYGVLQQKRTVSVEVNAVENRKQNVSSVLFAISLVEVISSVSALARNVTVPRASPVCGIKKIGDFKIFKY